MTIDEYADWAVTVPRPDFASKSERRAYLALGIVGEAGEAADTVRRLMRERQMDEDRLIYELGDLFHHWVLLCAELGQTPSDMMARSRRNIEARLAARKAPTSARHE